MGSRMLSTILAVASLAAASSAFSQTAPAAYEGRLPFTIGAGASNLNVDWGHNRMYGITVWGQWRPAVLPRSLYGLGIDVEARDISFDRSNHIPSNFRLDTISGGPIYTWHHFRNFQPYGKFLLGMGSIDFRSGVPNYSHDTRDIYAPGFGFQYRLIDHLWARADYEYQRWPNLFGGGTLDPQGFTAGVSYDFRSFLHFAGN